MFLRNIILEKWIKYVNIAVQNIGKQKQTLKVNNMNYNQQIKL